jgi:hypothetical protein
MAPSKTTIAAAGGILVLFAGSALLLDRLFSEPAEPRPGRQALAEANAPSAPPQPDLRLPPPAPLAPDPVPPAAPGAPAAASAPPAPAPTGRDLLASLEAARARILECGGVDLGELEVSGRARRLAAGQDAARPKTVLLLDLEPLEGQMAVRGLEVVSQGGHDGEDLVRCARQELEGRLLEASNAHPGRRLKMQFVVDRLRR